MPAIPQKPFHPMDVSRATRKWQELCDARKKQAELEKAARDARLLATLHSCAVQEAQNAWDDFNGEDN